jgi:hypothetical protein
MSGAGAGVRHAAVCRETAGGQGLEVGGGEEGRQLTLSCRLMSAPWLIKKRQTSVWL